MTMDMNSLVMYSNNTKHLFWWIRFCEQLSQSELGHHFTWNAVTSRYPPIRAFAHQAEGTSTTKWLGNWIPCKHQAYLIKHCTDSHFIFIPQPSTPQQLYYVQQQLTWKETQLFILIILSEYVVSMTCASREKQTFPMFFSEAETQQSWSV